MLSQLNQTVTSGGKKPKFSLLAGSYDTFLAFFGIANLTRLSADFQGLPEYASSMAFEVFSAENVTNFPVDTGALNVRFLFRNGTAGSLDSFPLFGREENSMPWGVFVEEMKKRAITGAEEWCGVCGSEDGFCKMYTTAHGSAREEGSKGGMSNAVAGVIGAMVTLGVVAIAAAIAGVLLWRKRKQGAGTRAEKGSVSSGSGSA